MLGVNPTQLYWQEGGDLQWWKWDQNSLELALWDSLIWSSGMDNQKHVSLYPPHPALQEPSLSQAEL